MEEHTYFKEYLNFVTFDKPINEGSNVSRGGLEVTLMPDGKFKYQNGDGIFISKYFHASRILGETFG